MIDKLTSRKFLITLYLCLASTAALFTGYLTGGEWLTAIGILSGIYGASNVTHFFSKGSK